MTSKKTAEDLTVSHGMGPAIIGANEADTLEVEKLKKSYPHAREIEKLASGNFAVRFRRKKPVYVKRSRA